MVETNYGIPSPQTRLKYMKVYNEKRNCHSSFKYSNILISDVTGEKHWKRKQTSESEEY
jgi:hypothetical protein